MIAIDFTTPGHVAGTPQSMTTFVWASKAGGSAPVVPVAVIARSSIDEWFVIDYRQRRHPLNPVQKRMLLQILAAWRRSRVQYLHELGVNARLEERFADALEPKKPPTLRERNATAARRESRRVRKHVREHADRATRARGPDQAVLRAPRAQGRY